MPVALASSPLRSILRPIVLCALLGLGISTVAAADGATGASDLLARANAAFAADRMVAPPGDNALEWTLAARSIEPESTRVQEGLNDLYPLVVAAIERDLRAGRKQEALRVIGLLEQAMPNSLAARQFRGRIDRRVSESNAPAVASLALNNR